MASPEMVTEWLLDAVFGVPHRFTPIVCRRRRLATSLTQLLTAGGRCLHTHHRFHSGSLGNHRVHSGAAVEPAKRRDGYGRARQVPQLRRGRGQPEQQREMNDGSYAVPSEVSRLQRVALILGGVFLVLLMTGALVDRAQFFHSYLVGYVFWVGIHQKVRCRCCCFST